jgi:hypothetical protein
MKVLFSAVLMQKVKQMSSIFAIAMNEKMQYDVSSFLCNVFSGTLNYVFWKNFVLFLIYAVDLMLLFWSDLLMCLWNSKGFLLTGLCDVGFQEFSSDN